MLQRRRARWTAIALLALFSCKRSPAIPAGEQSSDRGASATTALAPLESLVSQTDSVVARTSDRDPVGSVSGIAELGDEYVLLDGIQANLKIFSRGGQLIRTVGRHGEGPGEFRTPNHLAVRAPDRILVFDSGLQRASLFSSEGRLIRTFTVPIARVGAVLFSADDRIAFFGEATGRGPDGSFGRHAGLIVDTLGRTVEHLGHLPTSRVRYESNFALPVGGLCGDAALWGVYSANLLYVRRGMTVDTVRVDHPSYAPPDWDSVDRIPPTADGRLFGEWANMQTWMVRVLPVGPHKMLVVFRTARTASTDGPVFRYVLATCDGSKAVAIQPHHLQVRSSSGSTMVATSRDDSGNVYIHRLMADGPTATRLSQ